MLQIEKRIDIFVYMVRKNSDNEKAKTRVLIVKLKYFFLFN